MTVNVKFFAHLARRFPQLGPAEPMPFDIPDQTNLAELAERLEMPNARVVFVNGRVQRDDQYILQHGDELAFFPLLGGG